MASVMISQKVQEEVERRLSSKTRTRQVDALRCGMRYFAMNEALDSGALQLVHSVVFASNSYDEIGFVGEEQEVLQRIRAIPLPKEGKKGTPDTILIKMVLLSMRKIAGVGPFDDQFLLKFRELHKELVAENKRLRGPAVGWLAEIVYTFMREKFNGSMPKNDVFQVTKTLSRPDVDDGIIERAEREFMVERVMEE